MLTSISLLTRAAGNLTTITVWNYYLSPPFAINEHSGLAFDFVTQMNNRLGKQYHFKLVNLPRARLNQNLAQGQQGIVLFANWLWMGPDAKQKYLWSPAIARDHNVVISLRASGLEYTGPESLKGLKFGAVRGRKYYSLEALFESNELVPVYLNRERQALQMLLNGRIDVTSQPASLASYLIKEMEIGDLLTFSDKPLFSFNRHIMLTPKLDQLHADLMPAMSELGEDPVWESVLIQYGLAVKPRD